ncbi:hypothetical protein CY34DRAFT_73758, partial [Suillus luteus UH-Slu-Lm8-n1]
GTGDWQDWVLGEEKATIHIGLRDYDVGIFDTADAHSNGLSEVVPGNAINKLNLPWDEIEVMTDVYGVVGRKPDERLSKSDVRPARLGYVNRRGSSRKHNCVSIKKSICFNHFGTETPFEETMQDLHDVVQTSYVGNIGKSSCWAYRYYTITDHLTAFVSMQNHHNLIYREEEREMFPTPRIYLFLSMFGVGCIPWSPPLARGLLALPV